MSCNSKSANEPNFVALPNLSYFILLTNAVHPNRKNKEPKYFDWRHRIHSAVYESLSLKEKNPSLELRPRWINSK